MWGSSVSFKGLVSMRALAAVWLQVCVRSDDFSNSWIPGGGRKGEKGARV